VATAVWEPYFADRMKFQPWLLTYVAPFGTADEGKHTTIGLDTLQPWDDAFNLDFQLEISPNRQGVWIVHSYVVSKLWLDGVDGVYARPGLTVVTRFDLDQIVAYWNECLSGCGADTEYGMWQHVSEWFPIDSPDDFNVFK
jgi:hypothetical protein